MPVALTNPVTAFSNALIQPLESAAGELRHLADLHKTGNQYLLNQTQQLRQAFSGNGGDAFSKMILKQYQWTNNVVEAVNEIASLHDEAAQLVRDADSIADAVIDPFLDVVQWVLDRLTPDGLVREGESAVSAVFNDLKHTLSQAVHDGGGFFGDVFHGRFSQALHDAENEAKDLVHIGEDAIALVASVEPILCQWGASLYHTVNWCFNQVNHIVFTIEDWVFGLSDISYEIATLDDPNTPPEEKWLAGGMLGLNVILDMVMFIPGADLFSLIGRGVFKFAAEMGGKELLDMLAKKVSEMVVVQIIKDIIQKLAVKWAEKYSQIIIERALKRGLTDAIFKDLQGDLSKYVQSIIDEWVAGKLSSEEARAQIQAMIEFANKYGVDRFKFILNNYDPEVLKVIFDGDHLPKGDPSKWWEAWHFGPNWPRTNIPRNFILRVGDHAYYVNANATKHMVEYAAKRGLPNMPPITAIASAIEEAQEKGLLKPGKNFLKVGDWEIGIDTNEHVIYHLVYKPK